MILRAVAVTRDPRTACRACHATGGVVELRVICPCPSTRHGLTVCRRCGHADHDAGHALDRGIVADALAMARRLWWRSTPRAEQAELAGAPRGRGAACP